MSTQKIKRSYVSGQDDHKKTSVNLEFTKSEGNSQTLSKSGKSHKTNDTQNRDDLRSNAPTRTKATKTTTRSMGRTTSTKTQDPVIPHQKRSHNLPSSSNFRTEHSQDISTLKAASKRQNNLKTTQTDSTRKNSTNGDKNDSKTPLKVFRDLSRDTSEDTSSSSMDITTSTSATIASSIISEMMHTTNLGGNVVTEQETSMAGKPDDDTDDDDDECSTLLESPKKLEPNSSGAYNSKFEEHKICPNESQHLLHDKGDEIINNHEHSCAVASTSTLQTNPDGCNMKDAKHAMSMYEMDDDDDDNDISHGAALTMADDDQITTIHCNEDISFVVYPLGCCDFDETQLVSATNTRAIQKCILKLSNTPTSDSSAHCWGLDQSKPILMRLLEDHIKFIDLSTQTLLRSQPTQTIKTWAVDDDNTFAFVVEETALDLSQQHQCKTSDVSQSLEYALLNGPSFVCYVFRSMDDDDMSCRVASKLNEEINRYREQLSSQVSRSKRLENMTVLEPDVAFDTLQSGKCPSNNLISDEIDQTGDLDPSDEVTMNVKYIGTVQVPRPVGIDVLNVAIDKCLTASDSAKSIQDPPSEFKTTERQSALTKPHMIEARLHVSSSSVIVENIQTGEIIVECRIRYLTFMGISRRDIRWCGFIMQNSANKNFQAHCFECQPTAGHVCEAIQASCSRMYEKMVRDQKRRGKSEDMDAAASIIPSSSKIRDTLAKTLSRIKLTPII